MKYLERVAEFAQRQRQAGETADFMKFVFAHAKYPLHASGQRDAYAIQETLKSFRSVRIDGLLHNKGAVNAIDVPGFSSPSGLAAEWVTLTSAKSFLGRLSYRRVPFISRTLKTAAPDAGYVGEGAGIPAASLSLSESTALGRTKVGTIAVVSKDNVTTWAPGTRENLDAVLTRSVVRGLDKAALDPASAGVAGARPASLLYGVSALGALSATPATALTQVKSMLQALVNGGSDLDAALFVMHPLEAVTLSTMITAEGVRVFPDLGAMGGSVLGIPAVTSVGAVSSGSPSERVIALIDGAQVAVADDGEIEISASDMVTLHMDDATTQDSTTGTGTSMVSMFQTESVAIKVVRTLNFERLSDAGVAWLTAP